MEGSGIQPVMSMNPGYGYGNDGFFGGDAFAIFAILALMWGGGGFFGRGADGRCATVEDLNNSANFTRLESQVMNNGNRVEYKTDALQNGLCNLGYEMAQQFGSTYSRIDQSTALINANITAQTQKVLDRLSEDKICALQGRINQLELQQAMSGVVRYPQAITYSAGASPFCSSCCGGYAYGTI
nr:MAG TPA: hypothetical protein [Caudoviricetes sp.]